MLRTLRIKNLALVTDLTVEFGQGYNAITGETGAGKSILIGALSLVLGDRADRTLIRGGSDSCSVEAVFDVASVRAVIGTLLEENGIEACEGDQLLLKRTFTTAGANRQFINGSPAALNILSSLGENLVDIHGPHEHQSLLRPTAQLFILDAFGKMEKPRQAFTELVRSLAVLEDEKRALIVDEASHAQKLDLLRFQVQEITSARLDPQEGELLEQEHRRASNSARLLQLSQAALNLLGENENSVVDQAGVVGRTLQELLRIDASATELVSTHDQALEALRQLQSGLSSYAEKVDVDPARLEQLEERLDLIHGLKRKYGASIADILAFGTKAQTQLTQLEHREEEIARIDAQMEKVKKQLEGHGAELSARRRKLIPQLSKAVTRQLADLGFKQSLFEISLTPRNPAENQAGGVHANLYGFDQVEFRFAPNPGELTQPLRAIASSGELARVMLALKTVLAAEDRIPVLIFDEVDANVGGETARAVGEKMQQIARQRQVLCITHLPQVAAPATAHYVVIKQVEGGRTFTEVSLLNAQERVTELARMLGGQTEAARKHAKEMLSAS